MAATPHDPSFMFVSTLQLFLNGKSIQSFLFPESSTTISLGFDNQVELFFLMFFLFYVVTQLVSVMNKKFIFNLRFVCKRNFKCAMICTLQISIFCGHFAFFVK